MRIERRPPRVERERKEARPSERPAHKPESTEGLGLHRQMKIHSSGKKPDIARAESHPQAEPRKAHALALFNPLPAAAPPLLPSAPAAGNLLAWKDDSAVSGIFQSLKRLFVRDSFKERKAERSLDEKDEAAVENKSGAVDGDNGQVDRRSLRRRRRAIENFKAKRRAKLDKKLGVVDGDYKEVDWRAIPKSKLPQGRRFVESVIAQYFQPNDRRYGIEVEVARIFQGAAAKAVVRALDGKLDKDRFEYIIRRSPLLSPRLAPIRVTVESHGGKQFPEIISPKLRWPDLVSYARILPELKRSGAVGTTSKNPIGIHIHGEMNPKNLKALATLGVNFYGNIDYIASYFRPYSNRYSFIEVPTRSAVDELREIQKAPKFRELKRWFSKYIPDQMFSLNLAELFHAHPRKPLALLSVDPRRTAEFRIMNTVLTAASFIQAAKFVNAMINAAEREVLITAPVDKM